MTPEEFQKKTSFSPEELLACGRLPGSLLLPFHEITHLSWDEEKKTGRIEAVRHNRVDEWFYSCHFLGDPVMPGCWGVDAVWQALRFFGAWRGLPDCAVTMGMEGVSFFGQIRPYDKKVTYSVDIVSIEESEGERMITGKAAVSVDGAPVYSIAVAQVGTSFFEAEAGVEPEAFVRAPEKPPERRLSRGEFSERSALSQAEVLALSQGSLVDAEGTEFGLLPSGLMLEVGRIHRISWDDAAGEGRIAASKQNGPLEWFYPMNGGTKPAALTIDAVWQLLGLFLAWRRNAGTGRALGLERVEVFRAIGPGDGEILYEVQVLKAVRNEATGDASVRADARVFVDGRLALKVANANVGCHANIRYSDYPMMSEMGFGGKLKIRKNG